MPRLGAWGNTPGLGQSGAFSCRKNESSSNANGGANRKLPGYHPAGRPHDLRSGELSYFNMWGCIQLARRNTPSFVTAGDVGELKRDGGAGASACSGTASSIGRFDRIFCRGGEWPTASWQPNFTQR